MMLNSEADFLIEFSQMMSSDDKGFFFDVECKVFLRRLELFLRKKTDEGQLSLYLFGIIDYIKKLEFENIKLKKLENKIYRLEKYYRSGGKY